jgi:hypothetical protein
MTAIHVPLSHDPLPDLAESVGYIRGVLDVVQAGHLNFAISLRLRR